MLNSSLVMSRMAGAACPITKSHQLNPDEESTSEERKLQYHYSAKVAQAQTLYGLQRLYWAYVRLTFDEAGRFGDNYVPVRRDNSHVAPRFPDIDIQLLSPAFLDHINTSENFPNGTEGPTSHTIMESFMRSIADRNEWATFHLPKFTSEEGRTIPYLLLSNNLQPKDLGSAHKLRVWMQGGVHGNEPAGDQSLLALMGRLDADQAWTSALLKVMDIILLPRYNPDGVADFQRLMTSSIDGNRDHIKLSSQQTCDIKAIFNSFAPHIAIDMHEYSAPQVYGGNYQIAADALFSAAKNLNIRPAIREMSETLFTARIGKSLEDKGFRWGPYVTGTTNRKPGSSIFFNEAGSDGKIGRNAMGLTQSIAFLCETRGIGLADQHFRRRTAAALTIAETILQIAADNASYVYDTIEEAIRTFINSRDHIILTDQAKVIERTFTMIDNRNGLVSPISIHFASTTPVMAQTIRSRPEAYLIPLIQTNVVQRLEQLGMTVQRLDHRRCCDVEALHITSVSFGSTYYEGIVPVTVKVRIESKRVDVPSGTYLVSTRQKNAALAFIALEPENIDSYVSSNIIPVEEGNEYPILRMMREHST